MPASLRFWVYGPWAAASFVGVVAVRLLRADDESLHPHGWGLVGSAMICFSIGCVAKLSWELARANQRLAEERRMLERLTSR
ncbi:hypothetical protein [Synechococcus sp. CS-1328]|uniref:hypothetical protein n=1 Tax=Synechococcus sp. CS-1328 TaxID=2847976 RepID=UPI00223B7D5A|nr:hypothetical protein [Synechococcus sp. CS-1328]MCT0225282.1 hypothetical protein [Synechococcus sp. CS-1328]